MPYYDTLEEDVRRAKQILEKGRPAPEDTAALHDELRAWVKQSGGTIFGADIYAAYKLLESFVEAIEAVGPKVCELAIRHERRAREEPHR